MDGASSIHHFVTQPVDEKDVIHPTDLIECLFMLSPLALMANAWVDQAIEDVHDKVDQDHQAGD